MAPTPADNNLLVTDPTTPAKPDEGYWTKTNIAVTVVFAILALAIALLSLAFFLRNRSERKKREHRKSDRAGLLEHEDKTSMFSKERHSSVTLYVDHDRDAQSKRVSQESMPLVPLQVTPLDETYDPMSRADTTTASNGTGVSTVSRLSTNTLSTNAMSTIMLSPISPSGEAGDLSIRPTGRARSSSTASQRARYYESTFVSADVPPVPKIIRTESD
jgi:hypothetical protein